MARTAPPARSPLPPAGGEGWARGDGASPVPGWATSPGQAAGADLHVGRKLREARIQRGLSLAELAAGLGVSTPQARKYEAGRNAMPATRLPALAATLGVDLGFFFEGLHTEQRAGPYRPMLPTRPRMLLDLVRATDALPEAGLAALLAAARAFAGQGGTGEGGTGQGGTAA